MTVGFTFGRTATTTADQYLGLIHIRRRLTGLDVLDQAQVVAGRVADRSADAKDQVLDESVPSAT